MAAWPQKKTCQVLIQGRGWHRLTLKSALSCLSLVPQLNYWQGHISDFSIKMFYVEPGGFERRWKCFPFLSHSSLPVCKNQAVFGFSGPGMWLRTCAKGRKSKDGCPGSAEPHIPSLKADGPRERQTELILPFLTLLPAPIHCWSRGHSLPLQQASIQISVPVNI